jgi:LPXTG-motif cell wall-anchored protein
MKLNFWQWIGLVLLLIGLVMLFRRNRQSGATPATQPTTLGPLHPSAAVPPVV